ncbi:MAG TPA: hypothetical protein VGQ83_39750 [Polyangia bacterium]|jgi:hypothetical protein
MHAARASRQLSRSSKPSRPLPPRRRTITFGDLISAACEIGGSARDAARLLAPESPLGALLNRRIVVV